MGYDYGHHGTHCASIAAGTGAADLNPNTTNETISGNFNSQVASYNGAHWFQVKDNLFNPNTIISLHWNSAVGTAYFIIADSNGNFHPHWVFPIPEYVLASENDAIITNTLLKMGIENVMDDPGLFISLTITRIRELFKFWPTSDSTNIANLLRVFSFGLILPISIFGLFLSRKRWKDLVPIYLFLLVHTGVYSISWTMIRYRIPMDVFFIMFAAVTAGFIYEKIISRELHLTNKRPDLKTNNHKVQQN